MAATKIPYRIFAKHPACKGPFICHYSSLLYFHITFIMRQTKVSASDLKVLDSRISKLAAQEQ